MRVDALAGQTFPGRGKEASRVASAADGQARGVRVDPVTVELTAAPPGLKPGMRAGPFVAARACGSFAMGFAFGALGQAYLDRPAAGLLVSAARSLAQIETCPVADRVDRGDVRRS